MNTTSSPEQPTQAEPRITKRRRRATWRGAVLGTLVLIAAAMFSAVWLQYTVSAPEDTFSQAMEAARYLDMLVLFVVLAFVWAVLGRLWWTVGIVITLVLIVGEINRNKVELRREPFFPSDLDFVTEAGFVLSMVETSAVVLLIVAVVAGVAVIVGLGSLADRWFPRPRLRREGGGINKGFLATRIGILVVTGALLVHAVNFNNPPNMWRSMYEAKGPGWTTSSQLWNYRANGFMGGFLYNMPIDPMLQPDGYSAQTMDDITQRYEQRADEINAQRPNTMDDVNVVVVLSESFTDPSWMEGFELDTNPVPNTQQTMSETLAGTVYANSFGGGTSTMEFESLTGQPVGLFQPQVTSPFQMFVSEHDTYPSAVGAFNATGHHTVAAHAYNLHMYKRSDVYETLGFDEVIDDAAMQENMRIQGNPYVSDQSAYNEVLYQMDNTEEPLFMNVVTMQNHGPYGDFYTNPIASDIQDPDTAAQYGQYARGLSHTDTATQEFLQELRNREEETVVVFYGDHHPGVYNDDILGQNVPEAQVRTPFFVWNNKTNEAQRAPAVTPAMFLPMIYEVADAKVPPYIALLDDVRHTVPVPQHVRTLNFRGESIDRENLDEASMRALDDLTMVQYDFSTGQRYSVDTMWPGADD
ncbi:MULTISPECIES: LTA synthase family protein [Kocuria]|uniref:Sulfatase-like hydrolase/transferase n=1 Tax=Kocuria subflava TaxID=1736139 RepID=A0A846TRW3_9MICC|nr:LTA synthase family protein [Kocuria sp. CPCC 104605]NKE08482.1 sulfatase-like hydrolase/transferase [Kocuria subflava]